MKRQYRLLCSVMNTPVTGACRQVGWMPSLHCEGAATAKLLQSCPTVRPHRWQPTRLPHPWDSPGKNTGVVCHVLLQCMKVKSESEVTQSCPTVVTPWTVAHQTLPSMGLSRQKYWSGVPLPSQVKGLLLLLSRFSHV